MLSIGLVSDEHFLDVSLTIGVRLELSDPVAHAVEALLVGAVVDEQHTVGLVKVLHRHRPETFLTRRVPHEELHVLPIDLDVFYFEVDAHSRYVLIGELIIRELLEETTFAYTGVSKSDELNFHVKLRFTLGCGHPGSAAILCILAAAAIVLLLPFHIDFLIC